MASNNMATIDMRPRPVPTVQCRQCKCYEGCDLVVVSDVMKNLQKYDRCELVTLEEVVDGRMPRCEDPCNDDGRVGPGPSKPVTRAMRRRMEAEDERRRNAVTRMLQRRMEKNGEPWRKMEKKIATSELTKKKNVTAVRKGAARKRYAKAVCQEDGVVMEITLFRRTCEGECDKDSCGHCYARKMPMQSMKLARKTKKQMLRKGNVSIFTGW